MRKILIVIYGLIAQVTLAQDSPPAKYSELVKKADSLYNVKDYKNSGFTYSEAFGYNGWKAYPSDRYNAACSWAQAGYTDSALYHLERLASKGYTNYGHISIDPDLVSLYPNPRWQKMLDQVKANKEKEEEGFNKPVVAMLDSVLQSDQKGRLASDDIAEKYGRESKQMDSLWKSIQKTDSINLIKVRKILDEYGWLGADVIGNNGNMTLFLVIQHSDLEVQEKYLPMMREAVKNKKAAGSMLALLEDRVLLRRGKKQVYGSQIAFDKEKDVYYVQALEDPDHVDERRAEVGLPPLSNYVSRWKITWDIEQYKKELPALEEKLKKSTEH